MKKIILLTVLLIAVFSTKGQDEAHLYFNFDNKINIENVKVRFTLYDGDQITLQASETTKGRWMFSIPDTILNRYWLSTFYLEERKVDTLIPLGLTIRFPNSNDSLYIHNVYHFAKESSPELTLTYADIKYSEQRSKILYEISNPGENEWLNAQLSTTSSSLTDDPQGMLAYLKKMLLIHPNSRVVARWTFWRLLNEGEGIEADTLRKIYDQLPEEDRNSFFGQKFFHYVEGRRNFNPDRFQNMMLPESKSGIPEYVIQDTTLYNLVIFSHSACMPCHAMIPLLKEVYADLKGKLEITYISADGKAFVGNWKKVMEQKKIPWRSLLAVNNLEAVRNTYQVRSYPTTYLVYPEGKFESLDLREAKNKEKLYELIKNSNR